MITSKAFAITLFGDDWQNQVSGEEYRAIIQNQIMACDRVIEPDPSQGDEENQFPRETNLPF